MTESDRKVWLDVLSHLRAHHPDVCRQWFEDLTPLGAEGGVFWVRSEQAVRLRYLDNQCVDQFTEALQGATGRLMSVRFCGINEGPKVVAESKPIVNGTVGVARQETPARRVVAPGHESLVLSPDYSFENFIVGPETRLAHTAAEAVCEGLGSSYNPLFIYGGVGLGKTHLLQAVCQRLLEDDSQKLGIHYVSCEGFMTQFMEAVKLGQMSGFQHRFRDVDCLVIDDIQFLAKRDRTQEEFFHTFNVLYQSGKQIVLSSDRPPQDIPDLEARLVSRFQCGLVVELHAPSYETRVEIVKQKGLIRGMDIPDDVACFIAAKVQSNIRELEGTVVRVQALQRGDGKPIGMEHAQAAVDPRGRSMGGLTPEVTITNIIDGVVDYYGVKLTDLQSKRRQKSIAHPRQVCMYLARKHTRYSLEEIGGYFGGRDHTTVMHAVRTIERKRNDDEQLSRVIEALEQRFQQAV